MHRAQKPSAEDVQARRRVTRREREDGMVVIEAVLPADEAAIVYAAIEHEASRLSVAAPDASAETRTPDASAETRTPDVSEGTSATGGAERRTDRAGGLVAMAEAVLRGDRPARSPVEVVVTVSRDALVGGEGAGVFEDGTCVSAETARMLACDCGVVEMEEDASGKVLSVGRKTRSIPAAIGRALARRDETCRFPGCTNRRFLDGHHVEHWIHGGETDLRNLCRLCRGHHRFVHEHGYTIEQREGALVFLDPRGRVVSDEPPRSYTQPLGWDAIKMLAAMERLEIDAETGACGWDGTRVDYERVVDGLAYQEYRRPAQPS